jgi:hypothetical protein
MMTTTQSPTHVNPILWNQSIGYARQAAARIFRDGGTPSDAMRAFGAPAPADDKCDWSKAVEAIAEALSTPAAMQSRKAA